MPTDVVMPQMGESIAEGTITKWLAKVGDQVERDEPLLEISTDKVDAEIPSPSSGVLLEIRHQEGETVAVDAVVGVIGGEGEDAGSAPAESAAAPPAPAAAPAAAPATPAPAPAAAAPAGDLAQRVRQYSSPLVRKIAAKEGVDLSQVTGSGIHGRVTKKDIMAYLQDPNRGKAAATPPPAASAPAPASGFFVPAYTANEPVDIEKMSRIRKITADHMTYSKRTSAHVTTVFHIDMTNVDRVRAKAKAGFMKAYGTKLTYMPFIFKAVAAALRKHRNINASVDGENIVYKRNINLGMAVAMDKGLLVPVIKNADTLNLAGLAKTANDLADRARSKKLGPDELKGGTFTITNPGVFGSLFGTPIINQPQVAILGIGTIEKRPKVITDDHGVDAIAIRKMSYFGITYDHRVVDGADADHFMNDVIAMLEGPHWPELEPFLK